MTEILELNNQNTLFTVLKFVRLIKKERRNIFYDCQFEESPEFGIKLISIGLVDDCGNELYLINKDYDWSTCQNKWLINNVLPNIISSPDFIKVSKDEIREKVLRFICPSLEKNIKLYRILFSI